MSFKNCEKSDHDLDLGFLTISYYIVDPNGACYRLMLRNVGNYFMQNS